MRNNTVQQEEVRGMAVLDHVPEGWKVVGGCANAPAGRYVETAMLVGGKWILACEEDPKASQHHSQPLAWMPMPKAYLGKV